MVVEVFGCDIWVWMVQKQILGSPGLFCHAEGTLGALGWRRWWCTSGCHYKVEEEKTVTARVESEVSKCGKGDVDVKRKANEKWRIRIGRKEGKKAKRK